MKTLMDIMKSSMTSLYESILDDEEELLDNNYILIEKWLDENVDIYKDSFEYEKSYEIKNNIVNINGSITFKSTCEKIPTNLFKFGIVTGTVNCSRTKFKTLEGMPKDVKGEFACDNCSKLTSLKGAPEKVGLEFSCTNCPLLTSLEGAPKEVDGFNCGSCFSLKNLKGAPEKCNYFDCSSCKSLTSLEGMKVKKLDVFDCSYCFSLKNLKGAPEKCNYFDCSYCKDLISFEGGPKEIEYNFRADRCTNLTSLEGAPEKVGGRFEAYGCFSLTDDAIKEFKKKRKTGKYKYRMLLK